MKIVIASLLKPLDDTRHYYKLAKTLAEHQDNQVYVLARQTKEVPNNEYPNIHFQVLMSTAFSSIERLAASIRFFQKVLRIKPHLLIVCTHELLLIATVLKYLLGCKLVYDLQENYVLNIRTNGTYQALTRTTAVVLVKIQEYLSRPFINQFWLAEACYSWELSFPKKNSFVLPNKALIHKPTLPFSLKDRSEITLLFTGTVAVENGILEAFALAAHLQRRDPRFRLIVRGCCHDPKLLSQLETTVSTLSYIDFHVTQSPLPYTHMLEAMDLADIGLVLYRQQINFRDKMPTKVFEYTAFGLALISTQTPLLTNFYEEYHNAVCLNPENQDWDALLKELEETIFYPNGNQPIEPLLWNSEKSQLHEAVKGLL